MKIQGADLTTKNREVIVIQRKNSEGAEVKSLIANQGSKLVN